LGGRIENEIRFTDRPSPEGSVLAKTNSKFDMKTGAIAESQIRIFRDAQYDDFTKKETIARLKNIVRHELGHFLGLAHSNDSRAAMYAYYEPKKTDALLEDDTAAICDAYNPDGPVNQGCDVAPTVTSTFREASALPPAFLVGLTFTWLAKRRRGRNSPRTPARFP
jgi:hypothetical protein